MPEKRALLVTTDFPPTRGGIQTMAREIASRARRFAFTVIAPDHPDAHVHDARLGVAVHRAKKWPVGRRGAIPSLAATTVHELRRQRPDIVLAMHTNAAFGPLLARSPYVVFCHGGELRSPLIRKAAGIVFPRAARVLANSRFSRSEVIATGTDPRNVEVLPVGSSEPVAPDQHAIDTLRRTWGGSRVILTVARLVPHKGVDALMRALVHLPDDVHLVVVGDGPARDDLRVLATELSIAQRVRFTGAVDDQNLRSYYAAADAYAQLSRATADGFEGGGIALLDACAHGLPVVAGATGAIPETIVDGTTGLLVEPDDAREVARALASVLDGSLFASQLGQNARMMATGERSWSRFVERLEDVLEAVTMKGAASR